MKKPKWCNLTDDSCWSLEKGYIKSISACLDCNYIKFTRTNNGITNKAPTDASQPECLTKKDYTTL